MGCDGGVYESYDAGQFWEFKGNLPTLQFYDVEVDNSKPYYYVYGGTQDNASLGGPSRNRSANGIPNSDWFVTTGGDGFVSRIDPEDSNTVYAESQGGGLVRYDRRTGSRIPIKPIEGKGEEPYRWNWDAPLIVSPHSHTRLYFGANKLFRSDDRGNSWRVISADLTRQLDRNALPVMGRVWGPDAVAKNASTAFYGNLAQISESPKRAGLIYVGTDDGLIQVLDDEGAKWRKAVTPEGAPENAVVQRLKASVNDENTVFAAFDNHQNGDFKPYFYKSTDRGKTWKSISGNLPANGPVMSFAEDHVNPNLLFVGTEYGVYFSIDGGGKWIRLRGGLPTVQIRDMTIQRRENDLVLATFGRGFYVLDDYSPLRAIKPETLKEESARFPIKPAVEFIQASPLGGRGKGFQGESYYAAENPPFGAVFTIYVRDGSRTRAQVRRDAERAAERNKETIKYPTNEELRADGGIATGGVGLARIVTGSGDGSRGSSGRRRRWWRTWRTRGGWRRSRWRRWGGRRWRTGCRGRRRRRRRPGRVRRGRSFRRAGKIQSGTGTPRGREADRAGHAADVRCDQRRGRTADRLSGEAGPLAGVGAGRG